MLCMTTLRVTARCVAVLFLVCVYQSETDVKTSHWFFTNLQGAAGNVIVLQPTKTAMTFCDIDPGRWIDVPANFIGMGRGLTQEPPRRPFETSIYCTVVAIWNQFWSFTISSAASEPSSVFSPKPCRRQ